MSEPSIFSRIRAERGAVADIYGVFAGFGSGVEGHYELYSRVMLAESAPLGRWEREYLAAAVSRANACEYCVGHHEAALANAGERPTPVTTAKLDVLDRLALTLTREPHRSSTLESEFNAAGYSAAQWQHAVMVAAYFNFSNRLAFAMGLELETAFERTCR